MIRKIKTHIAKVIIFFILTVIVIWSCSISIIGVRQSENVRIDAESTIDSVGVDLLGGEELDLFSDRKKDTVTIIQTDTVK